MFRLILGTCFCMCTKALLASVQVAILHIFSFFLLMEKCGAGKGDIF